MRNFLKVFGIIAFVSIIGFSMVGCEEPDELDKELNGTWVNPAGAELKFDNGTFEISPMLKGTYTTSGNQLVLTPTHVFNEGKWLSKSDYKDLLKASATGVTDAEIDEAVNQFFSYVTYIYSIDGNKLSLTLQGTEVGVTYTKK